MPVGIKIFKITTVWDNLLITETPHAQEQKINFWKNLHTQVTRHFGLSQSLYRFSNEIPAKAQIKEQKCLKYNLQKKN